MLAHSCFSTADFPQLIFRNLQLNQTHPEIINAASAYAGRIERYVITDNFMPTIVPPEDSQQPSEHRDYELAEPFRASLIGALTTYPPAKFVLTNTDTSETMDLDAQNL